MARGSLGTMCLAATRPGKNGPILEQSPQTSIVGGVYRNHPLCGHLTKNQRFFHNSQLLAEKTGVWGCL